MLRSIGAIVPVNSQSGSCYIHRARYTRLLIERRVYEQTVSRGLPVPRNHAKLAPMFGCSAIVTGRPTERKWSGPWNNSQLEKLR